MKELVIFDVDGTTVHGQSQELFLRYLLKNKRIGRFFYLKLLTWFVLYKIGIIKNPEKPMTYAYSFLEGKSISEIAWLVHDFFERVLKNAIYPQAVDVIRDHKNMGRMVIFISNSIEPIVKELADYLRVDSYIATTLETKDGYYTGTLHHIIYGHYKTEVVNKFVKDNNLDLKTAWTYGDHISDQSLLSIVAHPVVVNPSPVLLNVARKKNWSVMAFKYMKV
ncbi:MAG: HAD family hydrolase [Minisyncoccota bacterium]